MKPIQVQEQVALGPLRCLGLTLSGMYYRLTRSLITIGIVGLAVAFLSSIVIAGVVRQNRQMSAVLELRQSRLSGEWLVRFRSPDSPESIVNNFMQGNTPKILEYQRWGGLSREQLERMQELTVENERFCSFFARLDPVSRIVVLGELSPFDFVRALRVGEALSVHAGQMSSMGYDLPLENLDTLTQWVYFRSVEMDRYLDTIQVGQQRAIDGMRALLMGEDLESAIVKNADSVCEIALTMGYNLPLNECELLAQQVRRGERRRTLTRHLAATECKRRVEHVTTIPFDKINLAAVAQWSTTPARTIRLAQALYPDSANADASELSGLLDDYRRTLLLETIAADYRPALRGGWFALPEHTRWLIVVSFLVCAVGICNTMFMSVTERFSEIATMKCLGALDGFIMLLFVFEAVIQGVLGSFAGAFLGLLLSLMVGVSEYGMLLFEDYPIVSVASVCAVAVLSGIVLSAASALAPAWTAARLAPMEAMRVE